ncbi:MAG: MBL fold metallo-hydrolase [Candidatus Woesearchaeota archaeon]
MTTITFLGTGGDSYVISKCIRNSGGIIIQNNEVQLHIDPGPNSLLTAKNNNINIRATTAIICTSPKISHSNDVNAVISGMTYNGVDIKGVLVATKTLIEGDEKNSPYLQNFFRNCVERIIIAEPEKKIGIENVDIHFCEANDYCDTVGLKIFMPDLVIGYSSDTSYSEAIAKQYENCDILIMNIQNPFGGRQKNNMCSDDAVKFIKRVKPQLAILTHFGKAMLEQDPLLEAREIHALTGVQVMAAVDGQSISPVSYSAQGKQKQLKQY